MKMKNYILFTIIVFISLASAIVTQVNEVREGIVETNGILTPSSTIIPQANAIGFVCANSACSSVSGSLWNGNVLTTDNNGQVTLTYPTQLQGNGYGIYFYKDGYIPFEVFSDLNGNGQANLQLDYLTKARVCTSTISSVNVQVNNNTINVGANIASPINNAGLLSYIPPSIESHYRSNVIVTLNATGPTPYSQTRNLSIPFSGQENANFSFTGLPGNYTLTLSSRPVDDKCLTANTLNIVNSTLIQNMTMPPTNTTNSALSLSIISPQNITYNTNLILLNINATNANQVLYSINNGTNQTYTSPITLFFQNGTNILRAYASNSTATISSSVTFSVAPTNSTNMTDITPPGSITNLGMVNKSYNFILWNWTNPTDPDFSQAIIYLNGINVANTTNNFYNATGLSPSTIYTITINTKDFTGNVNTMNVSNTQITNNLNNTTPPRPNSGGGNKKKTVYPLDIPEEVSVTHFQEDINETISLTPKKSKTAINWWWPLLLILACLLLLLLILIAALRKSR